MEFFTQREFDILQQHAKQIYTPESDEAATFETVLNKLQYWLEGYLAPNFAEYELECNRREKINKQAGRGAKHNNFGDYLLIGFAPRAMNLGKRLFIKIALAELSKEACLHIEVDTDKTSRTEVASPALQSFVNEHPNRKKYIAYDAYGEAVLGAETYDQLTADYTEVIKENLELYREAYRFAIRDTPALRKELPHSLALNTIFYGPPGTGKTYRTRTLALAHIEGLTEEEVQRLYPRRADLVTAFERYRERGRIEVCTFHPSMSYEDFVEGIKPTIQEESKEIAYQLEPGILKRIAERAQSTPKADRHNTLTEEDLASHEVFKLSLGNTLDAEEQSIYPYCIREQVIAIGILNAEDLSGYAAGKMSFEELQAAYSKHSDTPGRGPGFLKYFIRTLKVGDLVVIGDGNRFYRAIGRVVGEYEYRPDSEISYSHFRAVEWLVQDVKIPVEEIYEVNFTQSVIYKLNKDQLRLEGLVHTGDVEAVSGVANGEPYVLIIDELNRGNVPQIFGEMITLVEEDKRLQHEEGMRVTLPYSKEEFGLPANLHFIGTMNTADRSVEALDAALRRRFNFVPVYPNPDRLKYLFEISGYLTRARIRRKKLNQPEDWEEDDVDIGYERVKRLFDELKITIEKAKVENWPGPVIGYLNRQLANKETQSIDIYLSIGDVLEVINARLRHLLDEDHQFGHALFLTLASAKEPLPHLMEIWYQKFIPQLEEYFWGNREHLLWVLGPDFVQREMPTPGIFAAEAGPQDGEGDGYRYRIVRLENRDFVKALFILASFSEQLPAK